MNLNRKFTIPGNCIPVKGYNRSVICDLDRHKIYFIPNDLFEILIKYRNNTIKNILTNFPNEKSVIIDYFNYLQMHELLIFTKHPNRFSSIDLNWDYPAIISNCILDYSDESEYDILFAIGKLCDIGCRDFQIRFYDCISLDVLDNILHYVSRINVKSIEIVLKYNNHLNSEILNDYCINNKKIKSIIIHTCPIDDFSKVSSNYMSHILFIKQEINSELHCGQISNKYFNINVDLFTESQLFNTCLNKKLSINKNGDICNCPSINKTYGSISTNNLKEIIDNTDFKTYWNINKNSIKVCKICEFRHICTDCRAYIEDPDDILSKPLKCGYNPIDNTWSNWTEDKSKIETFKNYRIFEK